MKIVRLSTALLCSAALSACGGDGSSSGGTSAPSPTPSPSATASPAPTFTYPTIADLTGDQNFPTVCVGHRADGIGARAIKGIHSFGADGLIDHAAGSQTWTVAVPDQDVQIFGPSHLVESPNSEIRYVKTVDGRTQEDFTILRPTVAGIAAEYGRLSNLNFVEPGYASAAECVFGVTTNPADMPANVTYSNLLIDGTVFELVGSVPQASRITGGSGTIMANTTTGKIQISLSYELTAPGGAVTSIGPIQGAVDLTLVNGTSGYSGRLDVGTAMEYQVQGGFLGPRAIETGFVAMTFFDQNNDGASERLVFLRVFAR